MSNKQFNRNSGNGDKSTKKENFWSDFPTSASNGSSNKNTPNTPQVSAPNNNAAAQKGATQSKNIPTAPSNAGKAFNPPASATPTQKTSGSSWHTESRTASTSARKQNASPKQAGIFFPIVVLLAVIAVVTFILPKMEMFSDVVDISSSDADSYMVDAGAYISFGDEGAHVTSLQRQLFNLGYISAEEITGKYDSATDEAVSQCCSENALNTGSFFLSRDKYDAIMEMEEKEVTTTTATTTTNSTETTTTTATSTTESTTTTTTGTTAPTETTYSVKINKDTKLREKADPRSTAYYYLKKGKIYEYIEETTGTDGKLWYKVRYSSKRTGWVCAEDTEKIVGD